MSRTTVIDGRNHLLGRLASVVAKELLKGNKIIIVRAEEICISGSQIRNRLKLEFMLNKRHSIKPSKLGPFHRRAPSRMLWKTIRGMMPHKTARGAAALARLKTFDGIPPALQTTKRVVVPSALRLLRLKPTSPYTQLGKLAATAGWKQAEVVEALENKRRVRAAQWYTTKKADNALRAKAQANVAKQSDMKKINSFLASKGY